MAIAKELDVVHDDFIQDCPFCGQPNRIVVKGTYKVGDKIELHPDMGYSFCNCRSVFYTNKRNVVNPANYNPDSYGCVTLPDPFFAWANPYDFHYWDVRRYELLFSLDSFCDYLKLQGYSIESARHDFDVNSTTPQHFHVRVKK
jgi:hypothetical protein